LFILSQATVIRVIFEQSESGLPRATGVQYKLNCESCLETTQDSFVHPIVTGRRLVVIAAGALGTPQVLERSGVGSPVILKKAGIPVVVALPGVGENYQDHICIRCPYTSSLPPSETLDGIISGRQDYTKAVKEKNPILGWNGVGKNKSTSQCILF
jgi:choline dehydrogenase-like flavoprotein